MEIQISKTTLELIEQQLQRHEQAIDNLTSLIHTCQVNDATVNTEIKQILQGISELKDSVSELKEKPSKRWDLLITTIITTLVGGIVGVVVGTLL